jgi:hypothetical protein
MPGIIFPRDVSWQPNKVSLRHQSRYSMVLLRKVAVVVSYIVVQHTVTTWAFIVPRSTSVSSCAGTKGIAVAATPLARRRHHQSGRLQKLHETKNGPASVADDLQEGVVELTDSVVAEPRSTSSSSTVSSSAAAPFLSQGEIDPQALNPDLSDPKQARVIIYIILSLLPVLFLIPLMLGSRELIPLESMPPVQL